MLNPLDYSYVDHNDLFVPADLASVDCVCVVTGDRASNNIVDNMI